MKKKWNDERSLAEMPAASSGMIQISASLPQLIPNLWDARDTLSGFLTRMNDEE